MEAKKRTHDFFLAKLERMIEAALNQRFTLTLTKTLNSKEKCFLFLTWFFTLSMREAFVRADATFSHVISTNKWGAKKYNNRVREMEGGITVARISMIDFYYNTWYQTQNVHALHVFRTTRTVLSLPLTTQKTQKSPLLIPIHTKVYSWSTTHQRSCCDKKTSQPVHPPTYCRLYIFTMKDGNTHNTLLSSCTPPSHSRLKATIPDYSHAFVVLLYCHVNQGLKYKK